MEGKEIIINIKLTGDGAVDVKKLRQALSEFTKETEKNINVRKKSTQAIKGTEKAYLNEIKRIKQERAETARSSKQYSSYTKQLIAVENQLRDLTQARRDDVQVNAQFISNQGLASNTITEFGRLISDMPFGVIAITNNISQLGNQLGDLSRKTGSAKVSFDILLKQLKAGGAFILAFQVLVSLVTVFGDKILDFIKGTNEASEATKEFKEAIKSANQELRAEEARLLSLVRVLEDSTSSREAQNNAVKELAEILPGLNEEEIANKDNLDATRKSIEKYIEQQIIRAEIDALVEKNREAFRMKALLEEVDPSDGEAVDKFLKENVSMLRRFSEGALFGFSKLLRIERDKLFQDIIDESTTQTEEATLRIMELQKKLTGDDDDDDEKDDDGRDKVTSLVFGGRWKAKIGKSADEIEQFYEKTFKKILEGTDLLTADEQFEQFKENSKSVIDDISALDDKREENHQNELNRIKDEFDKRNQLADNIKSAVSKLSQIQDQAFQSQIKRLDTERDVILNNDNLTAEEKDSLLKKNDTETRKVRTKQIKFERDMHMIEMSMELAKIGLQLQGAMTKVVSDGTTSVSAGMMSIGEFMKQLGPFGIAAYAASIGGVIATIISARNKAKQQIQSLSNESLAVSGGGGGSAAAIQAPAFNVVGATQTSQLAQTIAGAEDKPLRAYVVASDVSTAQELERSTIEGASIG